MTEQVKQSNQTNIAGLFSAGAHYGAMRSRRHPSTKKFVFGLKNKLEIIDLEQTVTQVTAVQEFIKSLSALGKIVLFVGNKNEARKVIERGAKSIDMPYVSERWIGGTLTNFDQIRKRINRLNDLEAKEASGELSVYTKKERSLIGFEMADLVRTFGGIRGMEALPAALFVIDSEREKTAVTEARKLGIPVVALCNSDCNISGIDYAIVANDRSQKSIKHFVQMVVDAYVAGRNAKV